VRSTAGGRRGRPGGGGSRRYELASGRKLRARAKSVGGRGGGEATPPEVESRNFTGRFFSARCRSVQGGKRDDSGSKPLPPLSSRRSRRHLATFPSRREPFTAATLVRGAAIPYRTRSPGTRLLHSYGEEAKEEGHGIKTAGDLFALGRRRRRRSLFPDLLWRRRERARRERGDAFSLTAEKDDSRENVHPVAAAMETATKRRR
jgi:hypothetical protein